jgi:hypothetical protein
MTSLITALIRICMIMMHGSSLSTRTVSISPNGTPPDPGAMLDAQSSRLYGYVSAYDLC